MRGAQAMARRVLVTGAAGTIGTIVAEDLAADYDLTLVHYRDGYCLLAGEGPHERLGDWVERYS